MDDREVEAYPTRRRSSEANQDTGISLPGPACPAVLLSRGPNRGAPMAVARTYWARPPLVRPVAWSAAAAAAASLQNSYPRDGAALLSACHGLAVRGWGRGERGGAPHRTAAARAGRGAAPTRGRGSRRVAAHMAPEAPVRRGRGVEAAEPQPLASGVRWPRGRYAVGGMAPHAALPPRGSDGASAESNTDAPRDGLAASTTVRAVPGLAATAGSLRRRQSHRAVRGCHSKQLVKLSTLLFDGPTFLKILLWAQQASECPPHHHKTLSVEPGPEFKPGPTHS